MDTLPMAPSQRTPRRRFPVHIVVFLAPAVLIYTVFMIYPLIGSLARSLYAPTAANPQVLEFVGLSNYEYLFTNQNWAPRLQGAVVNNFHFFIVHMLVQNPIGLLLATLLTSRLTRFKTFFRTALFLPTMLSFVLVGFIWGNIILSPLWGIADDFFRALGLGDFIQPWLGQPSTALTTLSLISVWQFIGIPMLLFSAALLNIPEELIEAARVDGATAWGVFWRIKFPLILPTVGIVTILTFVGNFNAFDLIYTVQGALAGPSYSTDIMGTFFYRTFFGVQLQPGNPSMGAAVAGVMFFIILAGVLLYLFLFQRRLVKTE
jgi:raffinose/stachyose/melibiose transport system permease protein